MASTLLAASDELDSALEVLTTKLGAMNECENPEDKKGMLKDCAQCFLEARRLYQEFMGLYSQLPENERGQHRDWVRAKRDEAREIMKLSRDEIKDTKVSLDKNPNVRSKSTIPAAALVSTDTFNEPAGLSSVSKKSPKYNHVILEEDVTPKDMTAQQLQFFGRSKLEETDAALVRAKRTVAETNALAADTYQELQNQTSQLNRVNDDLDEVDNNLKESKKVIFALVKGQQCSKCTLCVLLLIVVGVFFIVLSETGVLPRGSDEEGGDDGDSYYEIDEAEPGGMLPMPPVPPPSMSIESLPPDSSQFSSPPAIDDSEIPIITIIGKSLPKFNKISQCVAYEDPGATATDNIDPPESLQIVTTGLPIDTSIIGIYSITYDVEDSDGNSAATKTRFVQVVPENSVCPESPVPVPTPEPTPQIILEPTPGPFTQPILAPTPGPNPEPFVDTVPPVIIVLGKILKQFNQIPQCSPYIDAGAMALDNVDDSQILTEMIQTTGIPTNTNELGVFTILYDVTDSAGNAAKTASRFIQIVAENSQCLPPPPSPLPLNPPPSPIDIIAPVITVVGGFGVKNNQVAQCSDYEDPGATAIDNVDGDITDDIVTTGLPLDTSQLGLFTIVYNVADSMGNQAVKKRFVQVTVDGSVCLSPPPSPPPPSPPPNPPPPSPPPPPTPPPPLDVDAPVITVIGGFIQKNNQVPQCSDYVDPGATAFDVVDGDITDSIVTSGLPLDTSEQGLFTIIYDVVDSAGNEAVKKRFVNVTSVGSECPSPPPNPSPPNPPPLDTTPPVITVTGGFGQKNNQVAQCSDYIDPGATAEDNIDGDLTNEVVTSGLPLDTSELGVFTVIYNVADSAGNQATKKRFIEVTAVGSVCPPPPPTPPPPLDTIAPVITALGGLDQQSNQVPQCSEYTDPGATANDNVDGDLTDVIVTQGLPLDTSELGVFSIVYDVTDSAGNQATETRIVEVTSEGSVCPSPPPIELFQPPPPLSPSFEVLEPNADTIWATQANFKINIVWEEPPNPQTVRILLLLDSVEVQILSTLTLNDGQFSLFTNLEGLDLSNDYQVRIEDSADPTFFGLSEAFTVAEEVPVMSPPPFLFELTDPIKVTSPGFQETFPQAPATEILVTWAFLEGLNFISVSLFNGEDEILSLVNILQTVSGQFEATIDTSTLEAGFDYRILVADFFNPETVFGFSAPFVIGDVEIPSPLPPPPHPPPLFDIDFGDIDIEVIQPEDRQVQTGGSTPLDMSWTLPPDTTVSLIAIDFVSLNVDDNSLTVEDTIVPAVFNSFSFQLDNYPVPDNLEEGSNYFFRVMSIIGLPVFGLTQPITVTS